VAEITPIIPSPTVTGVVKVRRDEARKNKPQKQPPEQGKADQLPSDDRPIQHIDEIV
jgi:hypothetical protein